MSTQIRFAPRQRDDGEWPAVDQWTDGHWEHWLYQHNHFPELTPWSPAAIEAYVKRDRYTYGVGFKRGPSDPMTWFYLPGPAAVPMHASKLPNLLYGGAAGGMKSHSIRWDAYRHCLIFPGYRSILMRRTFEELKRNHLDRAKSECERINAFLGRDVMNLVPSEHEIRFTNHGPGQESKIIFGHCQNPGDEERYLGDEYDDFRPDEMATFEKTQVVGVSGRLRTTKPGLVARLIGSSNPGGAHTLWLKRWFIDRNVPYEENPRYKAERYGYIPSKLYDNPYLMDPDGTYTTYEDRLYAYDDERRRQLLLGDWNAISGQFFPEFGPAHIRNMPVPPGVKVEIWLDWGYDPNPGVAHWVACLPNGRLYVFYEFVFRKLVAAEAAKKILQYTHDDVLPMARTKRLSRVIGDPSMFMGDGHVGESYAETFRRCGVPIQPGDNERIMGWGRYRHWLLNAPDGLPWLIYHPRCEYAVRTIPSLIRDKSDVDDVDTTGEDHAADADRYGVMARPTPTRLHTARTERLPGDFRQALIDLKRVQGPHRPEGTIA